MNAWHIWLVCGLCLAACGSAFAAEAVEIPLEAEDFRNVKGWRAEDITYFPSQPNLWSRSKLVADKSDGPALAVQAITVPHAGRYNVWVRYESCYGFGSAFRVAVRQGGKLTEVGKFGLKKTIKYFPFGRGWTAQGPWFWHNTDYAYEFRTVELAAGKAELQLSKDVNERPAANRVIDLLYLTDDLALRCGNDWNWRGDKRKPAILSRFTRPFYVKVRYVKGEGAVAPTIKPRLWLLGYYKGPMDTLTIGREGLSETRLPADKHLQPGQETGWMRMDLSTVMPPVLTFEKKEAEAELQVHISYEPEGKGVARTLKWTGPQMVLVCAVGKPSYEADIFPEGKSIITFDELVAEKLRAVQAYKVPERKAKRMFIQTSAIREGLAEFAAACGVNSLYCTVPAFLFGPGAPDRGFNTSRGFATVQNAHLKRECYEGDFSALEARYRKVLAKHKEEGVAGVPLEFKLIEESGPPRLTTLREWPAMREQFVAFLKERGVPPTDVLGRDVLADLLGRAKKPTEDELWGMVQLGTGDYAESVSDPARFYYSHVFRAELMARVCAGATKLLEKTFGPETQVSSGSFFPSTGALPVLARGDDPFTLFARRGVTSFSSEVSWGWGGSPDFLGPQAASYEGALARALGKYYDCPRGTYIIADANRGYNGDFIETYSYGLVANCFYRLNYYFIGWPGECSSLASSDIHRGIKRVSYTVGPVEDKVLDSDVVPAQVALGWCLTTDVWDLATPRRDPREVLNNIYPQERYLLYVLLRHCQVPVDVLGEEDLTAELLRPYKVYFLVGDHLRPESAAALRKWVEAGGTLIALAGGGLRDHCNRPLDTLKEVFGVEAAPIEKRQQCMRPKLELLHTAPLDRITFSGEQVGERAMDVYAYRQRIKPSDGTTVLGRFADGKPAATLRAFGKGKAILIGALPGLPYVRPAIPMQPFGRGGRENLSTFVPTEFDPDVRAILKDVLSIAGVRSPVVCSDPLVEATLLAQKDSAARHVVLVNYDTKPKAGMTVRLTGLGALAPEKAPGVTFEKGKADGEWVVRLKLDKFCVLTFAEK